MGRTISFIAPADTSEAPRHIKAAGDIGRPLADMAVLIFGPNALQKGKNEQVASPTPAPVAQGFQAEICLHASPGIRATFDAALLDGLSDILPKWLSLSEGCRHLHRIAATVFDRRLAMHEAAGLLRGGQA